MNYTANYVTDRVFAKSWTFRVGKIVLQFRADRQSQVPQRQRKHFGRASPLIEAARNIYLLLVLCQGYNPLIAPAARGWLMRVGFQTLASNILVPGEETSPKKFR